MLKELLAGSQTEQRPVTFLIAEEGSAGGLADTKTGEDSPRSDVINLFVISSVTLELADVWITGYPQHKDYGYSI